MLYDFFSGSHHATLQPTEVDKSTQRNANRAAEALSDDDQPIDPSRSVELRALSEPDERHDFEADAEQKSPIHEDQDDKMEMPEDRTTKADEKHLRLSSLEAMLTVCELAYVHAICCPSLWSITAHTPALRQ